MPAGITRGSVVIVRLDPAFGSEQKKTRPAVVVSPDVFNARLDTIIIVPLSTLKPGRKLHHHEVMVPKGEGGIEEDSIAQAIQVRTVDKNARVVKVLGQLPPSRLLSISMALAMVQGIFPTPSVGG